MGVRGTDAQRNRCLRLALLAVVSATVLLGGVSRASATVFTNPSRIAIADLANSAPDNATPYPSSIAVSGLGVISDVNVTLFGYSHTHPDDVGAVLVAPGGQALELMNAAGDQNDASNLQLTFDDSAATQLPTLGPLASGTYKPVTDNHLLYPAPGPGLSYDNPGPDSGGTATLASTFNGAGASGTWNLFVRDFFDMDSGTIAGGWQLDLTATPLVQSVKKKKCKKAKKHAAAAKKKKCKRKKGKK
jgi:subtilisin-like proprotein convertase family protein